MPFDLRHELSKEAPAPAGPLDMSSVWERGMRLRRRKHALAVVGIAVVAGIAAGALGITQLDRDNGPPPVAATERPEDSPSPEDPEEQLARVRAELYSQLRELRTVLKSLNAQRDELLGKVDALREAGEPEKARVLEREVEALDGRIADVADEIEQTQERAAAVTSRIIEERRPSAESGYVFVYFQDRNSDAYSYESYEPYPRRVPPATTAGLIEATLTELVRGPSAQERRDGAASVFTDETARIVRSVTLHDGTAIVDFEMFFDRVPQVTTSEGGAHLMLSLNKTVFQFEHVEAVEYLVQGSCDAFWEPKQGGRCHIVTRAEWERV